MTTAKKNSWTETPEGVAKHLRKRSRKVLSERPGEYRRVDLLRKFPLGEDHDEAAVVCGVTVDPKTGRGVFDVNLQWHWSEL
jgi:hypothetical protein